MTGDSQRDRGVIFFYFLPEGRGGKFFGGLAMSSDAAVHRFEYDGWYVEIELDGTTLEGVSSGHADLQRKGEHKCRIALAGKHKDSASAIASLSERSCAFIDDWDIDRGEGASPFIEG
jgi:hypothetical protein